MYKPPDRTSIGSRPSRRKADGGADFAAARPGQLRRHDAGTGGDIGWIAKGQLDDKLTDAIFAAPIGKTSEVVTVDDDGVYLFKVLAEETRTPEGRQLEPIKSTAFSNWYTRRSRRRPSPAIRASARQAS